jgi:hypothetical protein
VQRRCERGLRASKALERTKNATGFRRICELVIVVLAVREREHRKIETLLKDASIGIWTRVRRSARVIAEDYGCYSKLALLRTSDARENAGEHAEPVGSDEHNRQLEGARKVRDVPGGVDRNQESTRALDHDDFSGLRERARSLYQCTEVGRR